MLVHWGSEEMDFSFINYGGKQRKRHFPSEDSPLIRAARMTEGGIEHYGYIDIKQPAKRKGRKLKSWKRKWVMVHEMAILSNNRSAAKVDVYADEKSAIKSPSNKHTFILEYVTEVRAAKSKTHAHAFEIVENDEAVLLFGASSEIETQRWISAFKQIFWPDQEEIDVFTVTIIPNRHAQRLSLQGTYMMRITPEVIAIQSEAENSYEWSLPMLKRFHLETDTACATDEVLTIECGPKSECGEATFRFRSPLVSQILASIKRNIYHAISMKKSEKATRTSNTPPEDKRWRTSVSSTVSSSSNGSRFRSETRSSTEQKFRDLLESPSQVEFNGQEPNASKRTRLQSTSSESSRWGHERKPSSCSSDGSATRKEQNVSFALPDICDKSTADDILSSPVEILQEEGSHYNKVDFQQPTAAAKKPNIISMITVADEGYTAKVLLDDHGYSHVNITNSKPVIVDKDEKNKEKERTCSNVSSYSSVSGRSFSVDSKDSGILYQTNNTTHDSSSIQGYARSKSSFDSAVSTSSTTEQTESTDTDHTGLTVEIHEIEVSTSTDGTVKLEEITSPKHCDNNIYQDVPLEDSSSEINDGNKTKVSFKKSNSTGNFRSEENEYEDLEQYRKGKKDLFKHLGMDPKVDPSSVPPALPERPLSQKMKRKSFMQDKRLFTLPFAKHKNKKVKDRTISNSSSSESDVDSVKDNKTGKLSLKSWPLGNASVTAANDDLYQPVAIQRFLKDDDGLALSHVRERSSSLNLNKGTIPKLKRASISVSRENDSSDTLKHNRNSSMNDDILKQIQAESSYNMKSLTETDALQSIASRENMADVLHNAESRQDSFDESNGNMDNTLTSPYDEPIYAEVQPIARSTDTEVEEPFPDMDNWKPHEIREIKLFTDVAEANTINKLQSPDKDTDEGICNVGFYLPDEAHTSLKDTVNSVKEDKDNNNLLIDLMDIDTAGTVEHASFPASPGILDSVNDFVPVLDVMQPVVVSTANAVKPNEKLIDIMDIFNLGFNPTLIHEQANAPKHHVDGNKSIGSLDKTIDSVNPDDSTISDDVMNKNGEQESLYMDMSSCKNESIYVMPSTLK